MDGKDLARDGFTGTHVRITQDGLPALFFGTPPHAFLFIDESSRTARCRVCQLPIPAGQSRVTLCAKYGYRKTFRRGGVSASQNTPMHIDCLMKFLQTEEVQRYDPKEQCYDCRRPFNGEFDFERRIWARGHDHFLCADCWDSSRWRQCDLCCRMLPRSQTSVVVGWYRPGRHFLAKTDDDDSDAYACWGCAESDGAITIREQRRRERLDAEFDSRYYRILAAVERGELFDGDT